MKRPITPYWGQDVEIRDPRAAFCLQGMEMAVSNPSDGVTSGTPLVPWLLCDVRSCVCGRVVEMEKQLALLSSASILL